MGAEEPHPAAFSGHLQNHIYMLKKGGGAPAAIGVSGGWKKTEAKKSKTKQKNA